MQYCEQRKLEIFCTTSNEIVFACHDGKDVDNFTFSPDAARELLAELETAIEQSKED